jgi:Tfp pilus assembly pilus retraction ATPase PilT
MAHSIDDILQAAEDHQASDVFLQEGEVPRMKINEQLMVFGDATITLSAMAGLWQMWILAWWLAAARASV